MIDPTVYFAPNLDQHKLSANLGVKAVDPDLLSRGQHELSANLRVKAVDPDLEAIDPTVYLDPTL